MIDEAQQDLSREIYREPADDWMGDGYKPSVRVTPSGAITMCAGGKCVTRPISAWVEDAWNGANHSANKAREEKKN